MKLANLDGRATLVTDTGIIDLASASDGVLPSDPDRAVADLPRIRAWLTDRRPRVNPRLTSADLLADLSRLGPPVQAPRQIFAVGLNYADHSAETGLTLPEKPLVFTKFASSLTGPGNAIPLPTTTCDWEVELVAVLGTGGRDISAAHALDHVAGFCIGQDISERRSQMAGAPPQFSLAKSHAGFSPLGPWLTTLDELDHPDDLAIEATLDGETVQSSRTAHMLFDVTALIGHLSSICELFPGDLIFTGTPAGVGYSRTPARYLTPGNTLRSTIEGLGELRNPCIAA
ncbi:fumarylacetoacetate hydrolase family protein [Nocardia terpenica]|uniref:fumarylacetoacetate hydrolase family protein n=1 Tax=Nocardia terpenica TaxID=455432 RepID=UPI001893023D|nr:fumarylacetoacetate hydrolase family protein [Nocardia terpenica]MBF6065355.1 fumarylacetoacetate hydrolase family protein [Nocardia terpenica]MBF6108927.1 fumarylacetoacetate hydrolase family protein [Nocardia terpenica]MBF6121770.1 fumarylacetoacetate hydrolase family protein [Nocardia terpenica]